MAEDIAGAVDAGAFAIPDADHAVVARYAERVMDLAAEDGSGGEVFVDAGDEVDAVLVEQVLDAGESQIVAAEGRAFVTGDEGGGGGRRGGRGASGPSAGAPGPGCR